MRDEDSGASNEISNTREGEFWRERARVLARIRMMERDDAIFESAEAGVMP